MFHQLVGRREDDSSSSRKQGLGPEFTVDYLERSVRKRYDNSLPLGVADVRQLGAGEFSGSGQIPIQTVTERSHYYDIEFMCTPYSSASFSMMLKRGDELHWVADVGECGEGISAVSTPVEKLPEAESVIFETDEEMSFVVVVHEIDKPKEQ